MSIPTRERHAGAPVLGPWWVRGLLPAERVGADLRRPEWASFVEDVLAAAPDRGAAAHGAAEPGRTLHPVLEPLIDGARARFAAVVDVAAHGSVADLHEVWQGAQGWLRARLTAIAARTLVAALEQDRRAGRLVGVDAAERFADFVARAGSGDGLRVLLLARPALARLLAVRCLQTVDSVIEVLDHLVDDRACLVSDLLDGVDPGKVVALELGAGDLHSGGRGVVLLRTADGRRLVHKPRPTGLHERFNELLDWFAALQPELAPGRVRLVVRRHHGWAEHVRVAPCRSAAEVGRYYRRLGALLALLHAVDATDVHCENVIVAGAFPVLVDVETLFHPAAAPQTLGAADPALAFLGRSVARTALLPRLLLGEHGSLDVSGLGGERDADYPVDVPTWCDAGTDTMRLEPGRARFAGGDNRPELDGTVIDPLEHEESLLVGFRLGYETVVTHAEELVGPGGLLESWAGEEIRVLVRDTSSYSQLLTAATEPAALVDADARSAALGHQLAGPAHLARLVPHELHDMLGGDVPLFTALVGGTDVRAASGTVVPDLLASSGLAAVRDKVRGMGPLDLREQEWLVSASLATRRTPAAHDARLLAGGSAPAVVPSPERTLALARAIGDDLVARSRDDGDRVNWLGLELVDGRFWSVLPQGAGLAEGYCGTALFLAELGAVTGSERYLDAASRAVRGLPALLEVLLANPELARAVGSGGYHGLGGIAYAVARLTTLLPGDAVGHCLEAAVDAVAVAEVPGRSGLGEGTAGALAAVLAVHADTALPAAAALATVLAQRLRDAVPLPGAGLVHGAAGPAWGLRRWALATGRPPGDQPPVEQHHRQLVSGWCSGTAGILAAGEPADAVGFLAAADRPASTDHSLCHGDLGELEAVRVLVERGLPGADRVLARLTARVVGAVERHGPSCGTPNHLPSPGLLTGTSGIGYGLLRAGHGHLVPSVLLLQPGPAHTRIVPRMESR